MTAIDSSDSLPFTFDEFSLWYAQLSKATLEPAREAFVRILSEVVEGLEVEHGAGRYKLPASRVKDPTRLWAKMHSAKYESRIANLNDIPTTVDDLIGLRIVCTNQSDVAHLRRVLEEMAIHSLDEEHKLFGIAVEDGSYRNYIESPKPSGYRAIHANLLTKISQLNGPVTVRGELQVRSLLQDGWGELTHEDTYKPGQDVPELARVLSRRMGELLATVDAIAEDIRDELARNSQEQVLGIDDSDIDGKKPTDEAPGDGGMAPAVVINETRRLVFSLTKPATLAHIAARLRATFGSEALDGWLGHKSFKNFLADAVPEADVAPIGPSYIVPAGAVPDDSWPRTLREAVEDGRKIGKIA